MEIKKKVYGDYRSSHLNRGEDYDLSFVDIPHRNMVWRFEKTVLQQELRHIDNEKRVEFLDFACGTGRVVAFMEDKVATSTGVDISEEMLAVAKRVATKSVIRHGDITRETLLAGQKFNLVTAFRFFPNAEPSLRKDVIKSLDPLISKDGILIFNNHVNAGSLIFRLLSYLKKPYGDEGVENREMMEMIEHGGYEIVRKYHFAVLPFIDHINYLPIPFLEILEKFLSKFGFLRAYASNVLFVCRKMN